MSVGVKVNMNPQAYMIKLNAHLDRNLNRAALHVWRYVIKSFNNFGTHGMQKKTRAGHKTDRDFHIPSLPGFPPNVWKGHLKRSIGYDKVAGLPLVRRIGTAIGNKEHVNYAMALEKGTTRAGRGHMTTIKPRPYLKPGIKNNLAIIRAYLIRPMR